METAGIDAQLPPDPEAYERTHVHSVYDAIAPHFAATRHTPWPLVAAFVRAQAPGSVGLDVGCGSGRYLSLGGGREGEAPVLLLGSDRSPALVGLARRTGGKPRQQRDVAEENEVLVADGLALPFRDGAADFAICVAMLHHLSTRERRRDGIRQILRCLRRRPPPARRKPADDDVSRAAADGDGRGQALLYVWALEQASSRRGWDEGGEQDLLVPWVVKGQQCEKMKRSKPKGSKGGGGGQDVDQPIRPEGDETTAGAADQTFQRYYHLYRKGELEEDVVAAGGTVLSGGYERDNWWVIAEPG